MTSPPPTFVRVKSGATDPVDTVELVAMGPTLPAPASTSNHPLTLVEVIELKDHPFFIASQFHPEFQSKPNAPHPLFRGFIAAAHNRIHHKPL